MNSFRKVTLNEFEKPDCLNGIQELLEKSSASYETICDGIDDYDPEPFKDIAPYIMKGDLSQVLPAGKTSDGIFVVTGLLKKAEVQPFAISFEMREIITSENNNAPQTRRTVYTLTLCESTKLQPLLSFLYAQRLDVTLVGIVSDDEYAITDLFIGDAYASSKEAVKFGAKAPTYEIASRQPLCKRVIRYLLSDGQHPVADIFRNYYSEEIEIKMLLTFFGEIYPPDVFRAIQENLQKQGRRNLSISERRIASRMAELLVNIDWRISQHRKYPTIEEARKLLNDRLWGLEQVKQRVLEILAQIRNTDGNPPVWGILLTGQPGVGKTAVSLAIAEILSGGSVIHLDMSTIVEAEAICGSAPIFENSQPGIIFTALARNRASSATVIVNEIDKAFDNVGAGKSRGASCAAALLSLMDKSVGFLDMSVGVPIHLDGLFFVATANNIEAISAPIRDRFFIIDIPSYDSAELGEIWSKYTIPKLMKVSRIEETCFSVTEDAVQFICQRYCRSVRDLEKCAERLIGNYLLLREETSFSQKVYEKREVIQILGEPKYVTRGIINQPGVARTSYIRNGRALETAVEALVIQADKLAGGLTKVCYSSHTIDEQVQSAYYCALGRGVIHSTDKVIVQVDANVGGCDEGHFIGLAAYAAILSFVTKNQPNKNSAYVGGLDILGNVWADTSRADEIIQCCRKREIEMLYVPNGFHEHIHIPQGNICIVEIGNVSELDTFLGCGV